MKTKNILQVENLDQQQRAIKEQVLTDQKNDIIKYTQTINNNAKEEENKMLEGVLNQINSFSEEYGKTNGYDLVFGTTLSGSILYGCPARDITDEILEALNNRYKGID
ncbi:MAG: OmpH family outer membrane protein [Bacteroidia bacterium]|nr:OmpH family outer membrane protein [Bacteroidia bacterium]